MFGKFVYQPLHLRLGVQESRLTIIDIMVYQKQTLIGTQ